MVITHVSHILARYHIGYYFYAKTEPIFEVLHFKNITLFQKTIKDYFFIASWKIN